MCNCGKNRNKSRTLRTPKQNIPKNKFKIELKSTPSPKITKKPPQVVKPRVAPKPRVVKPQVIKPKVVKPRVAQKPPQVVKPQVVKSKVVQKPPRVVKPAR